MTKSPPIGIFLVALVFFFGGLLCLAQTLVFAFDLFGISPGLTTGNLQGRLAFYLLLLGLDLFGVYLVVRMHAAAKWLMLGMTLLVAVQLFTAPATSPSYSETQLYLNRVLLWAPMLASTIYLFRPRFRASKLS